MAQRVKNLPTMWETRVWSHPRVRKIPKEGNSYPFQYSCQENSMEQGAWQAIVHGVVKGWSWLTNSPVHPKGNQSWIFIGRTDAEAETPILWPPDVKSWLIGKDPDTGKDWRQEEKGTTEDEMGWMASPTWWIWVWASSRSCWWTEKPGMLQSLGSQRVRHDWETQLNWLTHTHDTNTYFWGHIVKIHSCVAN